MKKPSILTKEATTEIRKMVRRKLELEPDLTGQATVEAEIIKNHLMKAKIRLPAMGVEFTIFSDEPAMAGGEDGTTEDTHRSLSLREKGSHG